MWLHQGEREDHGAPGEGETGDRRYQREHQRRKWISPAGFSKKVWMFRVKLSSAAVDLLLDSAPHPKNRRREWLRCCCPGTFFPVPFTHADTIRWSLNELQMILLTAGENLGENWCCEDQSRDFSSQHQQVGWIQMFFCVNRRVHGIWSGVIGGTDP